MKYVNFKIKNIEPIKLTSTIMQGDNEFTKSYISGSNIRGAYIANYIAKTGIKDINKGEHKKKLLSGGLKFLNAYPMVGKEKTLPFPKCYYASKEGMKSIGDKKKLSISMLSEIDDEELAYDRVKAFDFAKWNKDNKEFNIVTLDKIGNLHIRKGFESDNKLFRYEAIKEGNYFKGSILCNNDEYAKEVKEILENGLFYFGGSKGSGYGLCEISNVSIDEDMEENKLLSEKKITKEFTIVLTSDIIYRNALGEYKSYIPETLIEDKLNIRNVSLRESFVETDYFTGYNNKWGYRIPKVLGIKAGSVFTYTFDGEINPKDILEFMNEGIGLRKSEGFGRIIILNKLNYNSISLEVEENKKNKVKLQDDENKQMQLIVDRIYKEKLRNNLSKNVLELNEKLEGVNKINTAQWGKLYRMMFLLEGMSKKEGINKLDKYFKNIRDKKLNRELANAFYFIKIGDEKFQEYLMRDLEEVSVKAFYNDYEKSIKIAGVESSINEEEIYRYKLSLFKELFRLQLKESERGK